MRRSTRLAAACLTLAAAGCAKSDEKADTSTAAVAPAPATPRTIALADLAGTWSMRSVPVSGDTTPTPYTLVATGDTTGWTMTLGNGKPIPVHVTISGDSVITDAGPYASVRRKGLTVRTHGSIRMEGGRLVGHTTARYSTTGPDSVLHLRTEGTRAP